MSPLKLLASLIDYLPHAIFWKDESLVFRGCNKQFAQQFGYTSALDVIGKSDYDFPFSAEVIARYHEDDLFVLTTGYPKLNYEELQRQSSGEDQIMLISKVPIHDDDNHIVGVLGIYTDITQRKADEKSLLEAKNQAELENQAKTDFIANMSHDIRTPLSGVVGLSQLLELKLTTPDQRQYARWIQQSGEELLKLLNGILDFVSIDHLQHNLLEDEVFNLGQCIQSILSLEWPLVQVKGLAVNVQIQDSIPVYLRGDRTKLHRVLLNLLGNAIKFTRIGAVTVDISAIAATNTECRLQFKVTDTGVGIPLEFQHKIFERFFRASPSSKGLYDGHGVGLSIAHTYVDLLGGTLQCVSEPGIGSTFYFDIALAKCEAVVEPETPMVIIEPTMLQMVDRAFSVLLIEDNWIALTVIEEMVQRSGLLFTSTTCGESALELIKTNDYDLIITDLGLPGISGAALSSLVRELEILENRQSTPIIGLTAHASFEVKNDCLKHGMSAVYSKPLDLITLESIKQRFLAQHSD